MVIHLSVSSATWLIPLASFSKATFLCCPCERKFIFYQDSLPMISSIQCSFTHDLFGNHYTYRYEIWQEGWNCEPPNMQLNPSCYNEFNQDRRIYWQSYGVSMTMNEEFYGASQDRFRKRFLQDERFLIKYFHMVRIQGKEKDLRTKEMLCCNPFSYYYICIEEKHS